MTDAPTPTRDKHGRKIMIGDVLKVYHFTAALRRKKFYMYKQVVGFKMLGGRGGEPKHKYFDVSHLNLDRDRGYNLGLNEGVLPDYEIVQGFDDLDERNKGNTHD